MPFAASGPADNYARFMAQRLQEALGQNFVVDNRPGAGSIIGTDAVAKSAPDGYTLLMMSNTQTVNESLIPVRPFNLLKDFVPIAPINYSDLVLVALRAYLLKICLSSSSTPRQILERSTTPLLVTARRITWLVSCSNTWRV